jgi:aminoglycoside phosphotransferase (APT) family kinase protein
MRAVPTPTRQLCAVLHDGRVLTDGSRRVPAYDEKQRHTPLTQRAATSGDASAVPVSPQLQVHADPSVLLSVFSPRADPVPGLWTPLTQLSEDDAVTGALRSVDAVVSGRAELPAGRPDWFRTSWYAEVEAWVDDQLSALGRRRTGPATPRKVWSMSAVVRIPADPAPVWLKAACRHFHAEPALTRLVGEMLPEHAPVVIATDDDRGWVLTEDMPGADEDAAPEGVGPEAARIMATLQLRSLDHLADIHAAAVPRRDLARTGQQLDEILAGSLELGELTDEEIAAARGVRDRAHDVLAELASLGIPDTLVHGDFHNGNVAHDGDSVVLYDWSDAAVSHPFLDVVLLGSRLPEAERVATRDAYAEVWRAAYPALDTARALELADDANTIYQMVTFEQIQRAQEEASTWEMHGVVAQMLRTLPGRLGG